MKTSDYFSDVDNHAFKLPDEQAQNIAMLALALTKNCKNDVQKARAVFSWIASHISYDWYVQNIT